MNKTLYPANERGGADHGWLKAKHSFSFADYHDPEKMNFGLLRVLNDDVIEKSKGFATHGHQDMEIISIPLEGALKHKDSEGNEAIIRHGEVQAMSAGTGVRHSEFATAEGDVNLLQIWILPKKLGIRPRYDQKKFSSDERHNSFQNIVAPLGTGGNVIEVNQDTYFSLANLDAAKKLNYKAHDSKNGLYLFLIEGRVGVAGENLTRRDAIGIENTEFLEIEAQENSQILLIEVPMHGN